MHGFLKHEFLKNRVLFLAILLSFILLLAGYYLYTGLALSKVDYAAARQKSYADESKQLQSAAAAYIGKYGLSSEDAQPLTENVKEEQKLLQNMILADRGGDWQAELTDAVQQLRMKKDLIAQGVLQSDPQIDGMQARYQYFLSESIRPKDSDFACDGLNVLVMITLNLLSLLLPACVLLVLLSVWLTESRSGSLKLLLWQARPKFRILLDKFLVCWLESAASCTAACLAAFLVCWVAFGLGDIRYPVFLTGSGVATTRDILWQGAKTIPEGTFSFSLVGSLIAGRLLLWRRTP